MCPSESELLAWVRGVAADAPRIAAHVDGCSDCQLVVGALQTAPKVSSAEELPALKEVLAGRYRISAMLGEGAMGVVFRCFDTELHREVAIKMVRGSGDAAQRRVGLEEARSLARLNHQHVVAVYDAFSHGPWDAIAMEYVEGQDVRGWMRAPHPRAEVERVMEQAALGLEAAHRAGVVHRDLKPENILIGRDGRVRVSDFGLSRSQARLTSGIGLVTHPAGTPAYMAPELLKGSASTEASDQYALCLTAIELLTGSRAPDTSLRLMPWSRGVQPLAADRWPSLSELVLALARRRRRRQASALLLLVAVAAVVTLLVTQLRPPPPHAGCAPLRTKFDALRAPEALREFDAKLESRLPASSRARSMEILRANFASFDTLLGEACQSERNAERAQLLALRIECLDRIVEGIGVAQRNATAKDGPGAGGALAFQLLHFDPQQRCGDERRVRAQAMTAEFENSSGLRTEVLALQAHFESGELEPVRAGLEPLIARARAEQSARALSPLLAIRASLRFDDDEPEGAYADLDEAISVAEAAGLDLATLRLSMARIAYARTAEEADAWTELARLRARRLGVERVEEGDILQAAGQALLGLGFYDRAAERFHRAAELWRSQLTPDDVVVASAESLEGGALAELGRFEEAEAVLTRSRKALEAATAPDSEERLDALLSEARLELLRERPRAARPLVEQLREGAPERAWVLQRWLASLEGRGVEGEAPELDPESAADLLVIERLEQLQARALPAEIELSEDPELTPTQWLGTALTARVAARRKDPRAAIIAQRIIDTPEGRTGRLARAHAFMALGKRDDAKKFAEPGTRLAAELR